jgi:hypothetical protein
VISDDKLAKARSAFLDLVADATDWGVDYDADTNSSGRMVDCSTYHIRGHLLALETLCETLGIQRKYDQPLDDAIQQAMEEEPQV